MGTCGEEFSSNSLLSKSELSFQLSMRMGRKCQGLEEWSPVEHLFVNKNSSSLYLRNSNDAQRV